MKVSLEDPPHGIRQLCEEAFDLTNHKPMWTFGDTIHNPHKSFIDGAMVAHEEVHQKQQGKTPVAWWERYLRDTDFRAQQELEAFRAQYVHAKSVLKDRNALHKYLVKVSASMASGMYGKLYSQAECARLIKNIV